MSEQNPFHAKAEELKRDLSYWYWIALVNIDLRPKSDKHDAELLKIWRDNQFKGLRPRFVNIELEALADSFDRVQKAISEETQKPFSLDLAQSKFKWGDQTFYELTPMMLSVLTILCEAYPEMITAQDLASKLGRPAPPEKGFGTYFQKRFGRKVVTHDVKKVVEGNGKYRIRNPLTSNGAVEG